MFTHRCGLPFSPNDCVSPRQTSMTGSEPGSTGPPVRTTKLSADVVSVLEFVFGIHTEKISRERVQSRDVHAVRSRCRRFRHRAQFVRLGQAVVDRPDTTNRPSASSPTALFPARQTKCWSDAAQKCQTEGWRLPAQSGWPCRKRSQSQPLRRDCSAERCCPRKHRFD